SPPVRANHQNVQARVFQQRAKPRPAAPSKASSQLPGSGTATPAFSLTLLAPKFAVKSPRVPEVTFSANRIKPPWPPSGKPPETLPPPLRATLPVSRPPWMVNSPLNARVGGPAGSAPKAVIAPESKVPETSTVPSPSRSKLPVSWNPAPLLTKVPLLFTNRSTVSWDIPEKSAKPFGAGAGL